jgi:lactoylglutathione lyase
MFSHVYFGVSDFERALAFYAPVMAALGVKQRFVDAAKPWAGWQPADAGRPLFLIGRPYDGAAHAPGNGQMAAFMAETCAVVDAVHAAASANGGRCEGPPGLRPEYHANYYGAYFRDPDGNKLCVACHQASVPAPRLSAVHPVLAARDVMESVRFFERLGFTPRFVDDAQAPRYGVIARDAVELHLQWADGAQWVEGLDRPVYRFPVDDVDALHQAWAKPASTGPYAQPADTPWGTREFHLRDPAGNGLHFYQPL